MSLALRSPGELRGRSVREEGGRLVRDPRPGSLGLLPSGSDPIGEWLVHRQPPGVYIVRKDRFGKPGVVMGTRSLPAPLARADSPPHNSGHDIRPRSPPSPPTGPALGDLPLCHVRLVDDARFFWIVLVPRRAGAVEIIDLSADERAVLMEEIAAASAALKAVSGCVKLNVAALGNMVPQLHVHIVGRTPGDAAWPGPMFGVGTRAPLGADLEGRATALRAALALAPD